MGTFLINTTETGFVFLLKGNDDRTIGHSQVYSSLTNCQKGIESVKNNCGSEVEDQTVPDFELLKNPKYEMYIDKANEYRFRLLASNGENIFASIGYHTKEDCLKGINDVASLAPTADVMRAEDWTASYEEPASQTGGSAGYASSYDSESETAASKTAASENTASETKASSSGSGTATVEKRSSCGYSSRTVTEETPVKKKKRWRWRFWRKY